MPNDSLRKGCAYRTEMCPSSISLDCISSTRLRTSRRTGFQTLIGLQCRPSILEMSCLSCASCTCSASATSRIYTHKRTQHAIAHGIPLQCTLPCTQQDRQTDTPATNLLVVKKDMALR